MDTFTGMAEVNNTRLYYEVAGTGPALVLIHGFTLDTRMWDDQFETFARHYRTVRYDARGFGQSALPTGESYTHNKDLKALLGHLGIYHAHVVGLSYGGAIAIGFAQAHPEATDALVLIDSILPGFEWGELGPLLASVWSAGRKSGVEAAKELWLALGMFTPALEKPDVATQLRQMVSDYSGWHWVNSVRAIDALGQQRPEEISGPTLVLVGERDMADFHAIADSLHRRIPGAKKIVLRSAGHMSNMEVPDELNQAVLSFLADPRPQ